jgi:hypothetical protein
VRRLPSNREISPGRPDGKGKHSYASILRTLQTPGGILEACFTPMARTSGEPLIFADGAAPAKLILPEIEWRKRPVSKDTRPDAGHRLTLSRWTVTRPAKPLDLEANYPDDSHLITFPPAERTSSTPLLGQCWFGRIGSPGEVGVSARLRRSEGAIGTALGYLGSLSVSPLLRAEKGYT